MYEVFQQGAPVPFEFGDDSDECRRACRTSSACGDHAIFERAAGVWRTIPISIISRKASN
jgi:hypothetical protein